MGIDRPSSAPPKADHQDQRQLPRQPRQAATEAEQLAQPEAPIRERPVEEPGPRLDRAGEPSIDAARSGRRASGPRNAAPTRAAARRRAAGRRAPGGRRGPPATPSSGSPPRRHQPSRSVTGRVWKPDARASAASSSLRRTSLVVGGQSRGADLDAPGLADRPAGGEQLAAAGSGRHVDRRAGRRGQLAPRPTRSPPPRASSTGRSPTIGPSPRAPAARRCSPGPPDGRRPGPPRGRPSGSSAWCRRR